MKWLLKNRWFLIYNGATVLLLAAGILLNRLTGFYYLRTLAALPIFFFWPGYNLSLLFFPNQLKRLERVVLALVSSFIIVTFLMYAISAHYNVGLAQIAPKASLLIYLATLFGGLVGVTIRKQAKEKNGDDYRPLWIALGIYVLLLVAIYLIYPFIPESDPYFYLKLASETLRLNSPATVLTARPLFSVLTASFSEFGRPPLYTLFKYLLPLLGFIMVVPIYAQARQMLKNNWLVLMITLLPLTVPVIMLENVIIRPQLLIMFVLPGFLYLLGRAISYRSAGLGTFLLVLSLILFRFHELGLIVVFVALAALLVVLWPEMKKHPRTTAAFLALILVSVYPYLGSITGAINGVAHILLSRLTPFRPRLWFLSNYNNIDGVQVGWPGITWLYYYAYNLGLTVPVLVLFLAFKNAKIRLPKAELFPALFSFIIFLSIAEILPRLNIAYLPDRAWPFLVLSACLLLPSVVKRHAELLTPPSTQMIIAAFIIASFVTVGYVTYEKQGSMTNNEYRAAQFLKDHTPPHSIVVTQGGNAQLVDYYGNRVFFADDVFAPSLSTNQIVNQLKGLPDQLNEPKNLLAAKKALIDTLNQNNQLAYKLSLSNADIDALRPRRRSIVDQISAINQRLVVLEGNVYPNHPNIYVLYSKDKFKFLYGQRAWWRQLNYADATFTPFADGRYFTQVYSTPAVTIWQLNY